MYYDLHIHSCLSPCANDDMTPNNIVNMSLIKGLDLIAVTDHNSLKQQSSIAKVCRRHQLNFIYGVEIQTQEEVHILAYFKEMNDVNNMQEFLMNHLMKTKNTPSYFGNQYQMDEQDQLVSIEPYLLLNSIQVSLERCIEVIHKNHGKVVIAHALDRTNSITTQLGFIPENLKFDGIEIKNIEQKDRLILMHPWLEKRKIIYFFNSDAHQLVDINEATSRITQDELNVFWG